MKLMKTDKASFNDLNKKNFERVMRLNQLAIDHMKGKKLDGRIIVSSNAKVKVNTKINTWFRNTYEQSN